MINQLISEFRKLLTVRSTYFISLFILVVVTIMSFWVQGYKYDGVQGNLLFQDSLLGVSNVVGFFTAIVAILLVTHEYRYNTIVYTLTQSNSRSKVLLAKVLATVTFVSILTVAAHLLAFALMTLGNNLAGHPLPAQEVNYGLFFARSLFFSNGFALAGLIFAAAIRNQVATFAVLFVVPNALEGLLNILLKEKSIYLPFSALGEVVNPPPAVFGDTGPFVLADLSPGRAAFVYSIYLVIGLVITWLLFLRRDAS